MKSVERSNWFFVIVLIVMIGGSFLLKILQLPSNLAICANEYLFLLVPVIIYLMINKMPARETLKLNKMSVKTALVVFLIALCSLPVTGLIANISSILFYNYVSKAFSTFSQMSLFSWILTVAVTPAICEEFVMRGVVLDGYRNVSIKKAAIVNGFLFGLFHLNFNQFFYAFALGIIMAYVVCITNSIFSSMIVHFTINGISAALNWRMVSTGVKIKTITDMDPNLQMMVLVTQLVFGAIFLVIMISLIKLLKKINVENVESLNARSCSTFSMKSKEFSLPVLAAVSIFAVYVISISVYAHIPIINALPH